MIPNVFISSTISDLQYLREALRDAVTELSYNPVMSEHGDVGYIHDGSAADACYVTIRQCHIAILIIGKRYGVSTKNEISVTHKEFRTAQEHTIPLITFVDADVMSFKKVYDVEPGSEIWSKFDHMDNPSQTFALIEEVKKSEIFNGMIEFRAAGEIKIRMKQQLAHIMGEHLAGSIRPIKGNVNEILAEVKALRNFLDKSSEDGTGSRSIASDPFYVSLRFLLQERNQDYTKFVEILFGDLDVAARKIMDATTIDDLIKLADGTLEVIANNPDFNMILSSTSDDRDKFKHMSQGGYGYWGITRTHEVHMSQSMYQRLSNLQETLLAKMTIAV